MKTPWLCRVLGHKFLKRDGNWVYPSDRCWRCGFRSPQFDEGAE